MIMSSVNKDSFISFFQTYISFISFPCLFVLAGTSSPVLKRSSERDIHALFLLSRKALSFSLLSMLLVVGFCRVFFFFGVIVM